MSSIKDLVRKPILKYKDSSQYFDKLHNLYFKDHPIRVGVSEADEHLQSLLDDGFVVLKNYHLKPTISDLKDKLCGIANQIKNNEFSDFESNDVVRYPEDGIYRLRNLPRYLPEMDKFFNDKYLLNLVQAYTHFPIRTTTNYLDYKPDVGIHDVTTTMHMDQWKASVKIFTLFSDVNEQTAPLVYWRKSHKPDMWRRRIDYFNNTGRDEGSGFCPNILVQDMEKVTVTAEAGTVIVADTRGIHRASNLYEGFRLQLVQKFTSDFYPTFMDVMKG